MSKTCKRVAILLVLALLMSFVGALAEESPAETPVAEVTEAPVHEPTEAPSHEPTEAPVHEPTEAPSHEPTETPAEAPTETPTEAPAEEPTEASTHKPEKEMPVVNAGYALVEGGVFAYTEPVISDATRIGQFTSASYLYVFERLGSGEDAWLRVAFAYEDGSLIGIVEGYVRMEYAKQVEGSTGAGPFIYNGMGLSKSSFLNNGVIPAVIIDPETKTSEQRKVKYKVGDEGSVVRISTGETVSTKKYVVKTSGPALNFRSVYNGTVSGRLETGDTVRVIEKGDRWAYLLIDGEVYTAMSAYLVEPEAAVEAPEEVPAEEETGMTEEDFRSLVNAIEITFRFEGDSVAYGDTVTLVARIPEALSGAEIQWQTQTPGGDWTNVEGAFGTTLSIVASESNASNIWRVQLTLG